MAERKNSDKKKTVKSSRFVEGRACGHAVGWEASQKSSAPIKSHSGPDLELFLAAPYMANSESCLSWVKAKNY